VKHAQLDTLNPFFYRCYELPTLIPGNPTLKIDVWDKNSQGAQLIGSTSIDIESRLLSQEWLEMSPKPVERRYLWSPASLAPQGKLEMWVEILTPPQALTMKPKVLRAPSALDCELRVVVWRVLELETRGKSKAVQQSGTADVFVTVQAGQGAPQESDVHHGAVDRAEFNWRYLFDVQQPTRHSKLTVQVWDTHNTGANDSLAECTLQLHQLYANVQNARRVHEIPRQLYTCTHPLYPGQQAKVDMSISMMPRVVAEELPNIAGMGRGAPNQNPPLPPPDRAAQILRKPIRAFGRLGLRGVASVTEQLGFSSRLPSGYQDALAKPSIEALLSIDNAGGNVSQVLRTGSITFTEERIARHSAATSGIGDPVVVPRSQLKALRKKKKLDHRQEVLHDHVGGGTAPVARPSLLQRFKR